MEYKYGKITCDERGVDIKIDGGGSYSEIDGFVNDEYFEILIDGEWFEARFKHSDKYGMHLVTDNNIMAVSNGMNARIVDDDYLSYKPNN